MKKAIIPSILFVLAATSLAGCDASSSRQPSISELSDASIKVYDLGKMYENPSDPYAKGLVKEATLKVRKDHFGVIYSDIETYMGLLNYKFTDKVQTAYSDYTYRAYVDGNLVFACGADIGKKTLFTGGSFSNLLPTPDPETTAKTYGSLLAGAQFSASVVVRGSDWNFYRYDYFEESIAVFVDNGKFYAPVSLFDSAFAPDTGVYHFFNTESLFQYTDALYITQDSAPNSIGFTKPAQEYYALHGMPYDLRLLDRELFYFTFENLYGLRVNRGVASMTNVYRNTALHDMFLSEDTAVRRDAYVKALYYWTDFHTGLSALPAYWGYSNIGIERPRDLQFFLDLRNSLASMRAAAYEAAGAKPLVDVLYSDSGETAYFSFDSFAFDNLHPYKDGTKEFRDDIWDPTAEPTYDTYFLFLHQLEAIKAKGGVKRVVLEETINGGGTSGIAYKLLALISKTNEAKCYTQNVLTQNVNLTITRLDSNGDGVYDLDDVYGDDFDFYIATSRCSFSCGNLFPIYGQELGAKVIGAKSGGGECMVSSACLASGLSFSMSGNRRIVTADAEKGEYIGVERGATPDIPMTLDAVFDVNRVEETIKAANVK